MLSRRRLFSLMAATAILVPALPYAAPAAQDDTETKLKAFLGVWDTSRRRPRRGPGGPGGFGGGPGDGRGGGFGRERGAPPPGRPDEADQAAQADDPVPGMDRGDRHVLSLMTEAGRKAFYAMKPEDLPANNCISPGLPHVVGVPQPQAWMLKDGNLVIHHGYYDTWRTIHLGRKDAPEGTPMSQGGYAVGWFDGDTFVIRTTHLKATAGGLARNAPASDARVVEERYRLADDGKALTGRMTISDSKYLTHPLHIPIYKTKAPEGTKVESFPCSLESARSYLEKPSPENGEQQEK